MGTVRTKVEAGVCGFVTEITAVSDDGQTVAFAVTSTCEKVKGLAAHLTPVDAYDEICSGSDGVVLSTARRHLTGCCAGCVVPPALFKSMQVAAGLALPCPIRIDLTRDGA